MTTHPHLTPRLKKEYGYTSPPLDKCGLFLGELLHITKVSDSNLSPETAYTDLLRDFTQNP
jgi:hypothetical protein